MDIGDDVPEKKICFMGRADLPDMRQESASALRTPEIQDWRASPGLAEYLDFDHVLAVILYGVHDVVRDVDHLID